MKFIKNEKSLIIGVKMCQFEFEVKNLSFSSIFQKWHFIYDKFGIPSLVFKYVVFIPEMK